MMVTLVIPTAPVATHAAARLSGKELLKFANDETTIAQFKDRIAKTKFSKEAREKAKALTMVEAVKYALAEGPT